VHFGPDTAAQLADIATLTASASVRATISADLEGSRMSLPFGTEVPNRGPIGMPGLRFAVACAVVAIFMFPLAWWGLTSIMPESAIFNRDGVMIFGFKPTLANYAATLFGSDGFFVRDADPIKSQRTIVDSIAVALGATALTLTLALPAAFALSNFAFRWRRSWLAWVVFQRVLPPIAVLVPLVTLYHDAGLLDTHAGVILAHASLNLPVAVLMLKSFFDDIPREVMDAGRIDGASEFQTFGRICLPLIRAGVAATAVLCFIFSWTEFLMSLFLTTSIRMLPVQLSIFKTFNWGFTAALGTVALAPSFLFILLVQHYLVRGLTLGQLKD
jgi:multiple sugar transport system permease protein